MICKHCNKEIDEILKKCPHCGNHQPQYSVKRFKANDITTGTSDYKKTLDSLRFDSGTRAIDKLGFKGLGLNWGAKALQNVGIKGLVDSSRMTAYESLASKALATSPAMKVAESLALKDHGFSSAKGLAESLAHKDSAFGAAKKLAESLTLKDHGFSSAKGFAESLMFKDSAFGAVKGLAEILTSKGLGIDPTLNTFGISSLANNLPKIFDGGSLGLFQEMARANSIFADSTGAVSKDVRRLTTVIDRMQDRASSIDNSEEDTGRNKEAYREGTEQDAPHAEADYPFRAEQLDRSDLAEIKEILVKILKALKSGTQLTIVLSVLLFVAPRIFSVLFDDLVDSSDRAAQSTSIPYVDEQIGRSNSGNGTKVPAEETNKDLNIEFHDDSLSEDLITTLDVYNGSLDKLLPKNKRYFVSKQYAIVTVSSKPGSVDIHILQKDDFVFIIGQKGKKAKILFYNEEMETPQVGWTLKKYLKKVDETKVKKNWILRT
jgi:hypothetical protein